MNTTLFELNFKPYETPKALKMLMDITFDEKYTLPEGFEWLEDEKNYSLKAGFSDNPEFLSKLFTFAQANHSGSIYALWKANENMSVEDFPVIMFGDEGGQMVVAENSNSFLEMLSIYAEPHISWDYSNADNPYGDPYIEYYDAEMDADYQETFQNYLNWLKLNFGIHPLNAAEASKKSKNVQAKLQASFDEWVKPLLRTY